MARDKNELYVDFEPISRRTIFENHTSLYEILTNLGVKIKSLCGGKGTCGKCKVSIQKGSQFLSTLSSLEKQLLEKNEIEEGWRLACQVKLNENQQLISKAKNEKAPQIRVYLPKELLIEDFKILTTGRGNDVNVEPNIKKIFIKAKKPTLKEPIGDIERVLKALSEKDSIPFEDGKIFTELDSLRDLSALLRKNENKITIVLKNYNEIISIEANNTSEENFGIAFDIGTTTIVGYLVNLNNGKIYATSSALNPQTAYGEDVITRIDYVKENVDGLDKLNSILIKELNKLIKETAIKARIDTNNIYEASVVGNSVMHHIFLKLNPISIGLSPYVPVVQDSLNYKAQQIGMNINKNGNVYTLPLIAGFVGADTMGVIISSEIEKQDKLTLAVDIGTNGELVIGNKNILATGSCAAGSALEGAHIKHGMRAASGAIESVVINPDSLDLSYTTINDRKPIGICGSGLIDLVAEMLKSKILTRSGTFNKHVLDNKRLKKNENETYYIVANKDETSNQKVISISQSDIRQIQMAKGAFYSGSRLILNALNSENNSDLSIEQVFLAGAFGNYIDKENARFIGMIPDLPSDKIFQIGNAAGIGAQQCLIN
ncbi:MAG: ASKHA domain-containing protein, partial [Candidatus Lokiarchaeota archaeon]